MLHAFSHAFADLADRRLLAVFAKSLAITLAVFAILGTGLYFLIEAMVGPVAPSGFSVALVLAIATVVALFWLAFRAVAIAVVGLFGDQVVAAVERRHYPEALAAARPVSFGQAALMGLRSVGRLIGWNLLAIPLYAVAAVGGVSLGIAFLIVNGWLLGRDLGDMVAVRHLDPARLRDWRAHSRGERFVAGLAVSGLFVVPGLNLVAPVVGAAAMTHLFHRGRRA